MTTLFLGGGGSKEDSASLDKLFLKEVKNAKRIIYIPHAHDKVKFSSCLEWFNSAYPTLKTKTLMATDLSKTKLTLSDAVYIGGGNTFLLLKEIRLSGFDKKLIAFAKKGGVIYGGSAGAIILGEDISTSSDENKVKLKELNGLGLVKDFSISPHYTSKKDKEIISYVKKKKLTVYAIPENAGVVIKDSMVLLIGPGEIKIFN